MDHVEYNYGGTHDNSLLNMEYLNSLEAWDIEMGSSLTSEFADRRSLGITIEESFSNLDSNKTAPSETSEPKKKSDATQYQNSFYSRDPGHLDIPERNWVNLSSKDVEPNEAIKVPNEPRNPAKRKGQLRTEVAKGAGEMRKVRACVPCSLSKVTVIIQAGDQTHSGVY